MFKVKRDMCPVIANNILIEGTNCHYDLCYRKDFISLLVKSVYHGKQSIALSWTKDMR